MRVRVLLAVILGVVGVAAAACGDEESGASQTVDLKVKVEEGEGEGEGKVASATLNCDGDARGSGFLADRAQEHCRTVRGLAPLLTRPAPADRVCTQVFGGPQTAHVSGTLGGRPVDRDLGRRNGCEIADWQRAAPLLESSGIRAGAGP